MVNGYSNREHQNADQAARRRALTAIDHMKQELSSLERRITYSGTHVDASETQRLASLVRDLTEYLAVQETLREVREWDAADQAEAAANLAGEPRGVQDVVQGRAGRSSDPALAARRKARGSS